MTAAKRSHKRKKWNVRRHLLAKPTRPSRLATPMQEPMKLTEPPTKCDKCGNTNITVFEEHLVIVTVRMAHCASRNAGCGKTWRLI